MQYEQLPTQILKTGFVLENQIAQQLKAAKWTVISNRYYVDDAEESIREIDLVAYQATRVQHFDVYTTLLVSRKKSEANAWALLSREILISKMIQPYECDASLTGRFAWRHGPAVRGRFAS